MQYIDYYYALNIVSVPASDVQIGDILVSYPNQNKWWKTDRYDWQFYKILKINNKSFITHTGTPDADRRYVSDIILDTRWPGGQPRKIPKEDTCYVMRGWTQ